MDKYSYFYDEVERCLYIYYDGALVKVEENIISEENAIERFEFFLDNEAVIVPNDSGRIRLY